MDSAPIRTFPRSRRSAYLGPTLTAVLSVAYFGFVILCAFAPGLLARPVLAGGTVTWAFAYGLFVIVLGVVLTGLYVLVANRADMHRAGA